MAPTREKSVEAERLTFTLPMVAAMLAAIATTAFAVGALQYWGTSAYREAQTQMQSDIRDIRTRMENQVEVRKLEKELLDAQLQAMKSAIDNATNRAAALSMAQENARLQERK